MSDSDIATLLAQVRQGDEVAARKFFGEYESHIRRMVRVRLTNDSLRREFDSVDVCQSVMADFLLGMRDERYEVGTPQQLVALLATMARNKFLTRAQRAGAAKRGGLQAHQDIADANVPVGDNSPSQVVGDRELLAAAVALLSADERAIAERRSNGHSWAEIAAEFGGTADGLRIRHGRALARVRSALGLNDDDTERF